MSKARLLALPLLAAAALGLGACGGNDAQDAADKVQKQGQDLQRKLDGVQGTDVRKSLESLRSKAEEITRKIRDGDISAADGRKQLEQLTGRLSKDATNSAKDAIDALKENGNVPDDVKKQLDKAKKQLDSGN